jgi:hypothetical protein
MPNNQIEASRARRAGGQFRNMPTMGVYDTYQVGETKVKGWRPIMVRWVFMGHAASENGTLSVYGAVSVYGAPSDYGAASVYDAVSVYGATSVHGAVSVYGAASDVYGMTTYERMERVTKG